eukprot:jgi/Psemu1/227663/e_gw1.2100.6.1
MSSSSPSDSTTNTKPPASEDECNDQAPIARGLNVLVAHAKKDILSKKNPPRLSHYRVVPDNVQTAYDLFVTGAQLVRATATKYALVGAISTKDQTTLGNDLLRGCELIGAAVHVTVQDVSGCSRAVRQSNQKAALAVYIATLRLVEAFHPVASKDNTVGAQKTGAVWEACDNILKKTIPQGNRNAIRREIFTWTRECNDTMEEFDEMIDLGPKEADDDDNNDDNNDDDNNDDNDDDDFFGHFGEDQYTDADLPLANACLALLKNSRGNMKIAVETCEALGEQLTGGTQEDDNDESCLNAILTVHEHAKRVGEGVTDLGSLMYPPLVPSTANLEQGVRKQVAFILEFQDYILGLQNMPTKIHDLANTLKTAAKTREKEFLDALIAYQNKAT